MNNTTLSDVTFLVEGCYFLILDYGEKFGDGQNIAFVVIKILSFLLQVDGSMLTESACLLLQMHFALCLMEVIG